jgi:hypothetical protein
MPSLSDLYQELSRLPKGTVVKKTIKGTPRFYLQWRENTRLVNRYVKSADKAEIEKQIARRKAIEKEIDALEKKLPPPLSSLSKNAKSFSGTLLSHDHKVAIFKEGHCLWLDQQRAPLFIKRTQNIEAFLAGRVLDQQRPNSRLLKKVLSLKESDNAFLALYSYGASLTDDYWFRPRGCKKHYRDIAFQNDAYANVALKGTIEFLPRHHSPSPQLSLGGSYEKCWKRIDDDWWIIKKGTPEERFSEYFVYLLGKACHFPMAEYQLDRENIRSKNFAEGVNFEPAKSLMDDNDDYEDCFHTIFELSPVFAEQYLRIIWLDSLVNNVDRHTENFGFLRSQDKGKILSLAPNFDNNAALIARGYPADLTRKNDGFIAFFAHLLQKNPTAKSLYQSLTLPSIDEALLHALFQECPFAVKEKDLTLYLLNGYRILKDLQ